MYKGWENFKGNQWKGTVYVRDFIQHNYTPYYDDDSFLTGPTERTKNMWSKVFNLLEEERKKGGTLDMETKVVSTIIAHGPGYIDKDKEIIVGMQTEKPLKRALQPYGGIRMAESSLEEYGYQIDPQVAEIFTKYRKTHNQGVFDAYTDEMKLARKAAIITGLPDAYGRGRIIGDYRRIALYGIDFLIADKKTQLNCGKFTMTEDITRLREELSEQIRALQEIKEMAASYGCDISEPATTAKEAVQWTYFGYLAAIKEQNGAAMSIGRISSFLDIYIERDIQNGILNEEQAQELIDDLVIKLRMVRFARTQSYNELFTGDPIWITESIGGMSTDGRPLVTKNSYRILNTLYNLGPAPEPNLTVLWSNSLPENFKKFCAKASIDTSAIQYENDDIMRQLHGDDYGIACCVSAMRIGKEMQFFGARSNLAKALLYAINGGVDEKLKIQVAPKFEPIKSEYLDYDEVIEKFEQVTNWLAELYVNTLNVIHYMHDKYSYERSQMALHDKHVKRYFATGIAGLSVVADSLSAIKYSKVKVIRDPQTNIAVDFEVEGEYPCFGNNDDRVDQIAQQIVENFMTKIRNHKTYRDSVPTMSILTITSNVVYGKKTGTTPCGRKAGEPLAPGANPMHGRDKNGALAALSSVAKLPYEHAQDGISYTFSIVPEALGKEE
ncbi:MAG: formate acetyltransferase [Haloplasmataceae bacterium]|jgi:formate C-acetyltransferase|nr:formate acetyltransferase [Haloplasmataceae bacterium]